MKKNKLINHEEQVHPEGQPFLYDDHKPVSRRDFIAQGFLGASGTIMLPTIAQLAMTQGALAQQCAPAGNGSDGYIPIMQMGWPGGPGFPAMFGATDQGGNFVDGAKFGLGSAANQARISTTLQCANQYTIPNTGMNGFFAGFNGTVLPAALQNTAFTRICTRTQDDTEANNFGFGNLVMRLRSKARLEALGSKRAHGTGVGHLAAAGLPAHQPAIVESMDGLTSMTGITRGPLAPASLAMQQAMSRFSKFLMVRESSLRRSPAAQASNHSLPCFFNQWSDNLAFNPNLLDTRLQPEAQQAFGINANTNPTDERVICSGLAGALIDGHSPFCSMDVGDHDYHNGTRATGESRDRRSGTILAQLLNYLHLKQKPMMLMLCSDGGVESDSSAGHSSPWRTDNGNFSLVMLIYYNPNGVPRVIKPNGQLGYYTSGGARGFNDDTAVQAVMINWGIASGKLNEVINLLGNRIDSNFVDSVRLFG